MNSILCVSLCGVAMLILILDILRTHGMSGRTQKTVTVAVGLICLTISLIWIWTAPTSDCPSNVGKRVHIKGTSIFGVIEKEPPFQFDGYSIVYEDGNGKLQRTITTAATLEIVE